MSISSIPTELRRQCVPLLADGEGLKHGVNDGGLTPQLGHELALQQKELLAVLEQSPAYGAGSVDPSPQDATRPVPQSFAQERFWFLQQFVADSSIYNVPCAIELGGRIDLATLRGALNALVARHAILRTRYRAGAQIVCPAYDVELVIDDLSAVASAQSGSGLADLLHAELRQPFDLSQERLLRARLYVLSEDAAVLMLTLHHIAVDEWTVNLLTAELRQLYLAGTAGAATPPVSSLQYTDFAQTQRRICASEAGAARLAASATRLQDDLVGTVLPSDRPRPAIQTYGGASHVSLIPPHIVKALRRLGAEEHASAFMVLLAAAKLLLFRYTRQAHISVGVPMTGRSGPDTQDVFGCFLNTLVMRTGLTGNMTGRELVKAVRSTCLDAYEYEDVPFEKLVETLQPQRDLSYNPLFQILFLTKRETDPGPPTLGLSWRRMPVVSETCKFDLCFEIEETLHATKLLLRYNTDLFDAGTINRFAGHFQVLLEALAKNADQAIGAMPLLTDTEIEALDAWQGAPLNHGRLRCAHQAFEAKAARAPNALALLCGAQRLSYDALNARSNQIAHRLIGLGVGRGDYVGVYCPRSAEMLTAILGVWKAGAAYVPIDPAYPSERVSYIVADAKMSVVLTQTSVAATLPDCGAKVLLLDDPEGALDAEPTANPDLPSDLRDLSHVIYTSGSTGHPKGTMIERGGVAALLQWAEDTYGSDDLSHVLASTSICFDLSVFELFAPLAVGGCVHLVENVLHLARSPGFEPVTLINTVPSSLQQLLQVGLLPPAVRVINLAGEPLQRSLVDLAYSQPQIVSVYNLYGPTEDTTYTTFCKVPRDEQAGPAIGVPLSGKRVHILDPDMRPVPVGVLGELYIGGAGLARGYLNKPEFDAERFLANPIGGERLYRTGDLARYLPSGQIAYAGRQDSQIKLRGFRIELGEIEAVLRQYSAVEDAVVVAVESGGSATALNAYFTCRGAPADTIALRAYLKAKLPGFMLPASLTALYAFPMTLNGKIDRKALPRPDRQIEGGGHPSHQSSTEKKVSELWSQLLGHDRFGVHDNFFEVGGHSLITLQLQVKLKDLFGMDLPIVDLFRFTTVRAQSELLQSKPTGSNSTAAGTQQRIEQRVVRHRQAVPRRKAVRVSRPSNI